MTYEQALSYIHSVSWKGSVPGLSRITELLRRLGDPQKQLKYVHIVGTNGKGSTAAMLASILKAAGYRTGLFTSPYVLCFRERMQIDNEMIPEEELAEFTARVKPHAEAMAEHPTEFELICAIALCWFAQKRCQIVVLEAGMGGEFDATNAIPAPEAAVFTNIGLDHTEYLGNTVEQIAATKAGVLKPGCSAVLYPNEPDAERVISRLCRQKKIPLNRADPARVELLAESLEGQRLRCGGLELFVPLLGEHQRRNAAAVLQTVRVLRRRGWHIPDAAIRAGLAAVRWPARLELLCKRPVFLLDGGHNPQCIEALRRAVEEYLPGKPLTLITGVLADKDYAAMYAQMTPLASRVFTLTPPNPRALSAEALAQALAPCGKPVQVCQSADEAVKIALAETPPEGAIIAFGSLYLAGEVREAAVKQLTMDN